MGSKRLPGKVLLPLNGHTVIGEVLSRCRRIPGVDRVVCAVPDTPENDGLANYVFYRGPQWSVDRGDLVPDVYRGPEDDVLKRYYQAAKATEADIIVRVTGDCPLICPEICGQVVSFLKETGAGYAGNVMVRSFPRGYDCEAFTMETLERADQEAGAVDGDREHVTPWMQRNRSTKRYNVVSDWKMEGRLTLDYPEDYATICRAFGHEPYQHLRAA